MRLPSLLRSERLPLLEGFFEEFDRFFDEVFEPIAAPVRAGTEREIAFVPDVDVIEHENDYLIMAELPGLSIDDVEVSVVGNALQIKGEKKSETEEEEENYHRRERRYGAFLRTIPLALPVQADRIEAKLEKGVLEIVCPKSEEAKPKSIEVKAVAEAATTAGSPEAPRPREENAREKQ